MWWRSIAKHLSGLIIFSIVFYVAVNFGQLWGPIKRRPFRCEDPSIRGPYLKDTITSTSLYAIGLYLPLAVIIVNEFIQHKWIQRRKSHNLQWLDRYLINLCAIILPFLYGFATERLLKNVAKYTVARLRPHFYSVCKPVMANGLVCTNDADSSPSLYVTEYTCSSAGGTIRDSTFSSFPSGHSSLTFYGMIFIVLYLQRFSQGVHRNITSHGLLLPVVQLLCLVLAQSVAVSRVLDFKHFWSDVFAGSALGSITAVIFSIYRERNMRVIDKRLEKAEMDNGGTSQVKALPEESVAIVVDQVKYKANEGGAVNEMGCAIEMGGV